jgi:hypothetical protein
MAEAVHIGMAAKVADVSVDTIRFYQKLGLIKSASCSAGGYRLFDGEQIREFKFVQHPQVAIAGPTGSAHFCCGFRRLWCLYLFSSTGDRQPGG